MSDGFRWLILGYCVNEAQQWLRARYLGWKAERMFARMLADGPPPVCGRGVEIPALTVPCALPPGHDGLCESHEERFRVQ